MKNLITKYLKETAYGTHDARGFRKAVENYFKDLGIKAKVTKSATAPHYGGSVTGGVVKTITIDIETTERFDVVALYEEIRECDFKYDDGRLFQSAYAIYVNVNEVSLVDYHELVIGRKFREGTITEDMVMKRMFDGIEYHKTFMDAM